MRHQTDRCLPRVHKTNTRKIAKSRRNTICSRIVRSHEILFYVIMVLILENDLLYFIIRGRIRRWFWARAPREREKALITSSSHSFDSDPIRSFVHQKSFAKRFSASFAQLALNKHLLGSVDRPESPSLLCRLDRSRCTGEALSRRTTSWRL